MKRIVALCLALILTVSLTVAGYADEATAIPRQVGQVVRVGFPSQPGLTKRDENGNYTGYTVDYLNELKKYTGWEYEYVEVKGTLNEQILTLMDMLEKGEIDLLGAMNKIPALQERYGYSGFPYGTSYRILATALDNAEYLEEDYRNWDGIRIGYQPGNKGVELLQKLAEANGFNYEGVEYESYYEIASAVHSGELDAMIQVDLSKEDDMKAIAHFAPSPYYFAVTKENSQLLQQLDLAMAELQEATPYLQNELYEKHFSQKVEFTLSSDNKGYMASLGVVKVLLLDGSAPIQYARSNKAYGMVAEYFSRMKEAMGLNYEFVIASDYEQALEMIQNGEVDLVAAIPRDSALVNITDMVLSRPYIDSRLVLVSNSRVAQGTSDEEGPIIRLFNVKKQLSLLQEGEMNAVYLDSYSVSYYLAKQDLYRNMTQDWSNVRPVSYCVGLANPEKQRLLSIINSYFATLDEATKQEVMYSNTVQNVNYTWQEFLSTYRWQLLFAGAILLMLGILMYLDSIRSKNDMLQKVAQQNQRLYQFSNLVNECLFEYDYNTDSLRIENNHVLFAGKRQVEQFSKAAENGELHSAEEMEFYQYIRKMILDKTDGTMDVELKQGTSAGWYRLTVKGILDENGTLVYAIGRIADIHQEVIRNRELKERSLIDPLTGLLNRIGGQQRVELCLKRTNAEGVMLLFDIDNFKKVNDNLGHPVGDELLKRFSSWMDGYFRQGDIKCRLGGDEFFVYVPKAVDQQTLSQKLQALIERVNEDVFAPYKEFHVALSIGAVVVKQDMNTYDQLYKAADQAMYIAKKNKTSGFFVTGDNEHTSTKV